MLKVPDDMLPDHPPADRGPYRSPGPRVYDVGVARVPDLTGVCNDDERGGTIAVSGDDNGES